MAWSLSVTALKWGSLVLLVLQNSTHALLIRYSRTLGGTAYIVSTTVVVVEVLKFVVSLFYVIQESDDQQAGVRRAVDLIRTSVKSAVPAGLYAMQNNLVFIALQNLDAATFQVMYQTKIITTAVFSVLMIGRRLSIVQWISLVLLFMGVILVQTPPSANVSAVDQANTWLGFLVVCAISTTSGFAGVYFERILKSTSSMSVFARNLQLAFWTLIFSVIGMVFNNSGEIAELGFFYGYTMVVWAVIFVSAFGGLLIAVVVKFTDNIAKGFATSISIVLSCVISALWFDFQITTVFSIGATIVVASVLLYSEPDKILAAQAAAAAPAPASDLLPRLRPRE